MTRLLYYFFEIFIFASKHSIIVQMSSAYTSGKTIITLKMALNLNLGVSARAHAQLSYIHTCASHMEEITGKFVYIYRGCYILQTDPSG